MASVGAVEKTAEDLRKEIEELERQKDEIGGRLGPPRGFRRGGFRPGGPRPVLGAAVPSGLGRFRKRGPFRPADDDTEDQLPPKRRISSQIVKVEDGEAKVVGGSAEDVKVENTSGEVKQVAADAERDEHKELQLPSNGASRRDFSSRAPKPDVDAPREPLPEPTPRQPKLVQDTKLVQRNQRMLGQLMGTLKKFSEEQEKLSSTEAYLRRSEALRRAEEKAREESEKLRQQQREQIVERRKRDVTLRARLEAKTAEKLLELDFIYWTEHNKKLSNFLRTKAQPPIYYMPAKPLVEDPSVLEQCKEQAFVEWSSMRRAELSEYQRQIEEQHIAKAEKELENWQNARNARRSNQLVNLQETMDQELETHKLEHGPKTRRIPGANDDDEDVEDIAAEDELLDEVLEVQDRFDADTGKLSDTGNGSPNPTEIQ